MIRKIRQLLKKYSSYAKAFKTYDFSYLDYPKTYWIDITNICNLKCIMCPQHKGLERPKQTMDMDLFTSIIDQIKGNKPLVKLYMSGEPLLHKNLFEMIEYAENNGCRTMIHTNATLLSKDKAIRLIKSSLTFISFSFEGCTPEIYEKVRVGANFEKVKSNIEYFLDLKQKMGSKTPHTTIEIIRMKQTEKHLSDFVAYWRHHPGVDNVNVKPYCGTWLGLVEDFSVEKPRNLGYKPCPDLFESCSILPDGTVVPCCQDVNGKMPLGNVKEESLEQIWYGKRYNTLRIQHLEKNIPKDSICYGCDNTQIKSRGEQIKSYLINMLYNIL